MLQQLISCVRLTVKASLEQLVWLGYMTHTNSILSGRQIQHATDKLTLNVPLLGSIHTTGWRKKIVIC